MSFCKSHQWPLHAEKKFNLRDLSAVFDPVFTVLSSNLPFPWCLLQCILLSLHMIPPDFLFKKYFWLLFFPYTFLNFGIDPLLMWLYFLFLSDLAHEDLPVEVSNISNLSISSNKIPNITVSIIQILLKALKYFNSMASYKIYELLVSNILF